MKWPKYCCVLKVVCFYFVLLQSGFSLNTSIILNLGFQVSLLHYLFQVGVLSLIPMLPCCAFVYVRGIVFVPRDYKLLFSLALICGGEL
jgi:hypothetical protein